MTTTELIEKIRDVLAGDRDTESFCIDRYGRKHMVCIDVDGENPPDPVQDYPVVAITGIRKRQGDDFREIIIDADLAVAVFQEEIITSGNTKTMSGFTEVQTLLELCENALYESNIVLDTASRGETQNMSRYPLFAASAVISFKILKTNRRGLPG